MLDSCTNQTGKSAQKICHRAGLRKWRTTATESEHSQQIQTITTVQIQTIRRAVGANHSHNSQSGVDEST